MRAPTYDEVQLLKMVAAEPLGTIDQADNRLEPYCSDESTQTAPDVFNSCVDLGWLRAMHDSSTDNGTAEITKSGLRAIHDPRPYELNRPEERKRLFREISGYLHTCRKCGGDFDGRRYAREAVEALSKE